MYLEITDLDFESETRTRAMLLQLPLETLAEIKPGNDVVNQLVGVQSAYFDFEATATGQARRSDSELLVRSRSHAVNGKMIRINSFNTAWLSNDP